LFDGRYRRIRSYTASVDGEDFVIVRFINGEKVVSVLELQPANQERGYTEEVEVPDVEEEVVAEVQDEVAQEKSDALRVLGAPLGDFTSNTALVEAL
jgi:hypothetical protein